MSPELRFDYEKLTTYLMANIEDFAVFGDRKEHDDLISVFQDNGKSVLAVGHLDTVTKGAKDCYWSDVAGSHSIICSQELDDRLGVFVLIEILQRQLGLEFDLLLTDGEESGQSTAKHFVAPRQYNWIFEFDRRGTDVVMYDYRDSESIALLELYGFEDGHGSFTDICELEHLGVKGFNFGVGYHRQHTEHCFANLFDTEAMICKFVRFFEGEKETHMPWEAPTWRRYGGYGNRGGGFHGGMWQERGWKKDDNGVWYKDQDPKYNGSNNKYGGVSSWKNLWEDEDWEEARQEISQEGGEDLQEADDEALFLGVDELDELAKDRLIESTGYDRYDYSDNYYKEQHNSWRAMHAIDDDPDLRQQRLNWWQRDDDTEIFEEDLETPKGP